MNIFLFISCLILISNQSITWTQFTSNSTQPSSTLTSSLTNSTSSIPSSTLLNSTDSNETEEPKPITCVPGISVGYMLIRQPNMTSILTIGNQYNISWDYTVAVTSPPSYLDVYIQLKAPGVRTTWKQVVVEKQPTVPRWFMWKPDGLVDGKYQMRFVPDGKETFNIANNNQPCFGSGESIPSNSATFSIGNPRGDLGNYPDKFPPNSMAKNTRTTSNFILVCMLSIGILQVDGIIHKTIVSIFFFIYCGILVLQRWIKI